MADLSIRVYENWFRRNLEFRAAHPGVIYDVFSGALVPDPIGTVRNIYTHYDLPWTDAYASKLPVLSHKIQRTNTESTAMPLVALD
jgi:hypothetical protein